ncbi:MAG: P-loop NTPase fold protein, partial [Ghiorsea sp.]|nr:P-loop NTPase fold protein [Ghiorsea sp.]
LSSILKLLPESERPSVIKAALPVAKFGIKTGLKAGVSWILKQDAADIADDFASDLKSAGDEAMNYAVESLLIDHVEAEERIETLKKALQEIAKNSPIVIFVDELDRCRPDFAVSMLESIKHVFDVENVQFVLVINTTQLRASIKHCYGATIEAQRYLDKFIAFSFRLPESFKPDGYRAASASLNHMKQLIASSKSLSPGINKDGHLELLELLIKVNQLSLREVETFVQHLEIYQELTEQKGLSENIRYGYLQLAVLGIFIFCFKPSICEQLLREEIDAKAIAKVLGKTGLPDISQDEWHRLDNSDVIAAIVGNEATINSENFQITDKDIAKKWYEYTNSFFGQGFPPDIGTRVKIAISAIETLQLGGK